MRRTRQVRVSHSYKFEGNNAPVPLYQVTHGRITKRQWNARNVAWCDICKEPISLWVNHIGRKDHALLDTHYTQHVEWERRWLPIDVLTYCCDQIGVGMASIHRWHGSDDTQRRNDIFALVKYLEGEKLLRLGDVRSTFLSRLQGMMRGMDCQGAMVFHEMLLPPLLRLFPEGHIFDYSNFVDFVSCSYNLETVYDLCGFATLDPTPMMRATSPGAVGLGYQGIAGSAEGISGSTTSETINEADNEAMFSRKAMFLRSILGQLRWTTTEDQVHPTGKTIAAHLVVTGKLLVQALMTELLHVRICEYIVRSEPVWMEFGLEQKKRDPFFKTLATPTLARTFYQGEAPVFDYFIIPQDDSPVKSASKLSSLQSQSPLSR